MKNIVLILCACVCIMVGIIHNQNKQINELNIMLDEYEEDIETLESRTQTLQNRFDYQMHYIEKIEDSD